MKKIHILKFANVQQEAEFWDTHNTTDYEGEFKPVRVQFAKNLSEGITIRIDSEMPTKIRTEATKKRSWPNDLSLYVGIGAAEPFKSAEHTLNTRYSLY